MSDPTLLPSAASGMTGWLEGSLPCMERRGRVGGSFAGGSLPCIAKASGVAGGLAWVLTVLPESEGQIGRMAGHETAGMMPTVLWKKH